MDDGDNKSVRSNWLEPGNFSAIVDVLLLNLDQRLSSALRSSIAKKILALTKLLLPFLDDMRQLAGLEVGDRLFYSGQITAYSELQQLLCTLNLILTRLGVGEFNWDLQVADFFLNR